MTRLGALTARGPGDGGISIGARDSEFLVRALKEGPGGKNRFYRTVMNKLRRLKLGSMREALNRVRGNFA